MGTRLAVETLEERTLLSLSVVLISDAVAQAQQIRAAAATDTIAIVYHADTMTTAGMADLLASVSAAHSGDLIGHFGIVAHGGPGEIDLGNADDLSLTTLPCQTVALERLRSVLTSDARLDLYSCSVAAGACGKAFVNELSNLTGAAVFASDSAMGTVPGANFTWDYHVGYAAAGNELSVQELESIPRLCLATYLTGNQVAQAAFDAGFRSSSLVYAVAVAHAESSFQLDAVDNDSNGTTDYGLWQINSSHGYNSSELLSSADYNAGAAYSISSSGANWDPWVTFYGVNGVYTAGEYGVASYEGGGPYLNYLNSAVTSAFAIDSTVVHAIGDTVVATTSGLKVRDTAGGNQQSQERNSGDTGVITGSYQASQIGGSGKTWIWWQVRWSDGQTGWSAQDYLKRTGSDTTPPTASAFNVTPTSVTSGNPVTISFTVSDTGGSGLSEIWLYRAPNSGGAPGTWAVVGSPLSLSGNGPVSSSFSDTPAVGKWWYGFIVYDGSGNWNNEQNVNTAGASDFQPIEVTATLAAPVLAGPGNSTSPGPTVSGTSQTLQWDEVSNATSYLVQWQDVTAGTGIKNQTISSGSTTSYTVSGLNAGDTYLWNIYAYAGTTPSPLSATYYFAIQTSVAAPTLVGPGNSTSPGPTVGGPSQTFQWDQVSNATSYLLQWQDVTAGTGIKNQTISGGSTTSYTVSGLNAGHAYLWNMYAYEGSTMSPLSANYYFTIQSPPTNQSTIQTFAVMERQAMLATAVRPLQPSLFTPGP
jgi:hypothetical protein